MAYRWQDNPIALICHLVAMIVNTTRFVPFEMPCSLVDLSHNFGRNCCLHLEGWWVKYVIWAQNMVVLISYLELKYKSNNTIIEFLDIIQVKHNCQYNYWVFGHYPSSYIFYFNQVAGLCSRANNCINIPSSETLRSHLSGVNIVWIYIQQVELFLKTFSHSLSLVSYHEDGDSRVIRNTGLPNWTASPVEHTYLHPHSLENFISHTWDYL
jgi:hypothetical protein